MRAPNATKPPTVLQHGQGQETKALPERVVVSQATALTPSPGTLHADYLDRWAAIEWGFDEGYSAGWDAGRAALQREAVHAAAARNVRSLLDFPKRGRGQAA